MGVGIIEPKDPRAASGLVVAVGCLLRLPLVHPAPVGLQLAVHGIGDPARLDAAPILPDRNFGRMLDDPALIEMGIFQRNPPDELPVAVPLSQIVWQCESL